MAWLESHQALRDHPKKDRLAELLFNGTTANDVADMAAVGVLHHLWWWALDYAQDGDLTKFTDRQIAKGCKWTGDGTLLVESLIAAGFIDRKPRRIHDWGEYAGRLIVKREQDRERKAKWRASAGQDADAPQDGAGTDLLDLKDLKNISSSACADDGFLHFWSVYPRKIGKVQAKKRWSRMTKKDRGIATAAAAHLADWQRETATELQYVPHPATFIGPKRSFEDWAERWPAGYKAGDAAAEPAPTCPDCRKQNSDMPLTYDEDGDLHCSFCGWKDGSRHKDWAPRRLADA